MNGLLRKMVPKSIEDLICDFNYIGNSMYLVDDKMIDVPFFYTKQVISIFLNVIIYLFINSIHYLI